MQTYIKEELFYENKKFSKKVIEFNFPFDSSNTKLTIFTNFVTPNKGEHVQDCGKRR